MDTTTPPPTFDNDAPPSAAALDRTALRNAACAAALTLVVVACSATAAATEPPWTRIFGALAAAGAIALKGASFDRRAGKHETMARLARSTEQHRAGSVPTSVIESFLKT